MVKSEGKKFEEDFQKSIPEGVFFERRKDDGFGYKGVNNGYDYLLYSYPNLFFLELKSTKDKSLPFSMLKENQIKFLANTEYFRGMYGGFLFNFRRTGTVYYINGEVVQKYVEEAERKSFTEDWCRENGFEVKGKKLRTRFRWDVEGLMLKMRGERYDV